MNSDEIRALAEDIDTAISMSVNRILDEHHLTPIERATVCIAVAGLAQGRNDLVLGADKEANALFDVFKGLGAERFAALKKRSMN